jgi:AraC-like DNA-binding protein
LWARAARRRYAKSDSAFDRAGGAAKNAAMGFVAHGSACRTRSVEQAREHVAGIFTAHRLACATRELDFALLRSDRPRMSFARLGYGAEVVVDAPALERFYLLQLTLAGRCEIELGRRTATVGAGELLVINPTRPYRKRWGAACVQLIARLDRALVDEAWTVLHGAAPSRPLEFAFANLPAAAAGTVARALRAAAAGLDRDRALAEALVSALPPAEAGEHAAPADLLVRRAEAFMRAHLGLDLAIGEIAQAAGASPRTLERAFRRERQSTAVARLRELRLERARAALVAARGGGPGVTAVAASVGIVQPGRFAVEYRRRFGESPSQTLREAVRRRPS